MRNDSDVRADVHALWAAVFGEPPILEAPTKVLIDALVASLPKAEYQVLTRFGVAAAFDGDEPPDRPAQDHSPARVSGPSSE